MEVELFNLVGSPAEFVAKAKEHYTFDEQGLIVDPGKFERETVATLYFYACSLDGSGEDISEYSDDEDCCERIGPNEQLLTVDDDERAALRLDATTAAVVVTESDSGFVSLTELNAADLAKLGV